MLDRNLPFLVKGIGHFGFYLMIARGIQLDFPIAIGFLVMMIWTDLYSDRMFRHRGDPISGPLGDTAFSLAGAALCLLHANLIGLLFVGLAYIRWQDASLRYRQVIRARP